MYAACSGYVLCHGRLHETVDPRLWPYANCQFACFMCLALDSRLANHNHMSATFIEFTLVFASAARCAWRRDVVGLCLCH